jgi:hypothetical protein
MSAHAHVEFYSAERRQVSEEGEVSEWTEWRWRVKAGNNEIVASGEAHTSERDAKRAFLDMRDAVNLAYLDFMENLHKEVFE